MAGEIERKWVVSEVPAERMAGRAATHLRQGYLAFDGPVELRLRISDGGRAVLTVKVGATTDLRRTEVEAPISIDDAEELWPHTAGRRIEKRRHVVPLPGTDGLAAEIDVYEGALHGLCTIEVEFPDVGAASTFTAPDWFGTEVTGRPEWTNAALARGSRPELG
jgi:CYTH domain-containing protein